MEELDRLESRRGRSLPLRVWVTLATSMVVAALVAVSWSWHPGRHSSATPPAGPATNTVGRARPSVPATARPSAAPGDAGSVFVQPLADCVRTDHRHSMRIAMAIQNLADEPLQLVSADVVGRIPGLTLKAQTVGSRPCADRPRPGGRRIRPAEELVVALEFAVGPTCPPATAALTARLSFVANGTVLHAETANLVELSSLALDQCR